MENGIASTFFWRLWWLGTLVLCKWYPLPSFLVKNIFVVYGSQWLRYSHQESCFSKINTLLPCSFELSAITFLVVNRDRMVNFSYIPRRFRLLPVDNFCFVSFFLTKNAVEYKKMALCFFRCPDQTLGDKCQLTCANYQCLNNGTCFVDNGSFKCR